MAKFILVTCLQDSRGLVIPTAAIHAVWEKDVVTRGAPYPGSVLVYGDASEPTHVDITQSVCEVRNLCNR